MPKIATALHPLFRPLFKLRQRAMSEEMARARLERLRSMFIISREGATPSKVRIWVRDYGVSEAERTQGINGHFVIFQVVQDPDGWRIAVMKDVQPIEKHPERARPKGVGMPNWGHPVLRSAKKGREFYSQEDAEAHLKLLTDEFPKAARTKQLVTRLHVYSKHPEHGAVLEPILIRLEPQENGRCIMRYMADPRSRHDKLNEEQGIQGDFTKKLVLGKSKPKSKARSKPNPGQERLQRLRSERAQENTPENPAPIGGHQAKLSAKSKIGPRVAPISRRPAEKSENSGS